MLELVRKYQKLGEELESHIETHSHDDSLSGFSDQRLDLWQEIIPKYHELFTSEVLRTYIKEATKAVTGKIILVETEPRCFIDAYDDLVKIDQLLCENRLHYLWHLKTGKNESHIRMWLGSDILKEKWDFELSKIREKESNPDHNMPYELFIIPDFLDLYRNSCLLVQIATITL